MYEMAYITTNAGVPGVGSLRKSAVILQPCPPLSGLLGHIVLYGEVLELRS